ncbi:glycosyltransferase [Paracoccus sp. SJTW-4]|uniref:glycosyltransferase n=1 Tax=Paracoccus sp. SJTW-4 TaxID=3078428 RepID=UPI0039EA6598
MTSKASFVIISIQGWTDMWVSKHWIANLLTNYGDVYFVEPFRGALLRGRGGKLQDFLFGPRIRQEKQVNVVTMSSLPGHYRGFGWYRSLSRLVMRRQMEKLDNMLIGTDVYVLTFDYRSEPLIRRMKKLKKTLYYAIDVIPPKKNDPWWPEKSLVHFVDGILTTSERHRRRLIDAFGRDDITLVPHGVDFSAVCAINKDARPDDLPQGEHVIGYTGTIHDRYVDFDVVREVALARPNWDFVFIGPVKRNALSIGASERVEILRALPNTHFLGQKSYQELPGYIAHFDACIMPYNPSVDNEPFKTLNYLAQGKPIVATDVPGISEYRSLLYTFVGAAEMIASLENALAESKSDEIRMARVKYAQERDFRKIAELILAEFGMKS